MLSKYSITSIDGVCTIVLNKEAREALHNINLTNSKVNLGVSGDMEASGYASQCVGLDEVFTCKESAKMFTRKNNM